MDTLASRISPLHLEDLRNELHPSHFDENPEYDMLVIRLPVLQQCTLTPSVSS